MKPWMVIVATVMFTFLVVGLAESEGKAFGQLGGYSRYSPSGDYTGGHQFDRGRFEGRYYYNSRYFRYSNTRFVSYSGSRRRSYRGRYRGYNVDSYRSRSKVGCR